MSKKDKHITSPEDFLNYHTNKMSGDERNAFERKLHKDPFDDDASEGFSSILSEEATRDLKQLRSRIQKRSQSGNKLIWYRIAASVAILAIVSSVFYTVIKNRIDKGTGQLIVSETISDEKEEKEISRFQPVSPVQPEEKKPDIAGAGDKKIVQPPLKDAGIAKKTESTGFATVQEEKTETLIESADLITEEVNRSAALPVPETKKMIIQEEKSEIIEELSLVNSPKTVKPIKGIVLSSGDSSPLPGVSVLVKGTNLGTITDMNGLFTIPASRDSATILMAQVIGMESKETKSGDSSFVTIEMESNDQGLSEVVVVGFGSRKRLAGNRSETMKDKVPVPASQSVPDRSETRNVQLQLQTSNPAPLNGFDRFNEYVRKNQVFPSTELKLSSAKVILNFLVRIDGTKDSITVVKSPGEEFSAEAIRLLKEGPGWRPAMRNGEKVEEAVQIKIILNSTKE